jgi:hypothetical protein
MIVVTKNEQGWLVGVTRLGVCGCKRRHVLYTRETLNHNGIDYETDPHAPYDDWMSNARYLVDAVMPDKLITPGESHAEVR